MQSFFKRRSVTARASNAVGLHLSLIVALTADTGTGAAQTPSGADLTIDYSGDRLSVHADRIALDDLLERMAAGLGIAVFSAPEMPEPISIDMRNESVEAAFRQILRGYSYVLSFSAPWTGIPEESPNRLWVFSNGGGVSEGSINPIESSASIRGDTPVDLTTVTSIADTIASAGGNEDKLARALTSIALNATSDAAREEAVYALGELNLAAGTPQLHKTFDDPAPRVREAAIVNLRGDDPEILARLANALGDPDAAVRDAAILALFEIGSNGAQTILRNAASDPNLAISSAASEAISELEDAGW